MTLPTFLLCPGAQKSGTTWLHRYLVSAPSFARGAMKEYHVWDELHRCDRPNVLELEGEDIQDREALRSRLIADPDSYFDHFAALLEQPGKRLTADITPAYASLPEEAFARIREGFRKRDIAVKVVFLMRDPVERCWSAARMYRRKSLSVAGLDPALGEADFVLAYASGDHAQRRGRYERSVKTVEDVFAPSEMFFGFYEELFASESVERLSEFAGIESRPEQARGEYNVSPKDRDLPADVKSAVARLYEPTLRFCAERFPHTRSLWESYSLAGLD